MVINRLGGMDPLQDVQGSKRTQDKLPTINTADSINVSDEARELAEAYYAAEVAAVTPDVRADRVAEVKEKMKNPAYINQAVINVVAERIMDAYGI
ncbi:MAG: flagellar biosynthesis anti-sigma factor FlgM [Treponemataceae bacterium]|nr:flagellar biosynthesis anti-sigma factor FlgM [Treponemataceae bacterium]